MNGFQVLEVEYEETVADPEAVARRLVAFCGLDQEPGCLAFHEGKRPVRTASVSQVRQPISTRSVARWKHYESALGKLFALLEDGPGGRGGLTVASAGSISVSPMPSSCSRSHRASFVILHAFGLQFLRVGLIDRSAQSRARCFGVSDRSEDYPTLNEPLRQAARRAAAGWSYVAGTLGKKRSAGCQTGSALHRQKAPQSRRGFSVLIREVLNDGGCAELAADPLKRFDLLSTPLPNLDRKRGE